MVIESLDSVVNAVPNLSASLASRFLVGTRSEEGARFVIDILGSRVFGYFGGLGFQAFTVGYTTGHFTNSLLTGFGAGVSSATFPLAVKAAKFGYYIFIK